MFRKPGQLLALLFAGTFLLLPVATAREVTSAKPACPEIITGTMYPEGIEYDTRTGEFILGSFRRGQVYRVDRQGRAKLFIDHGQIITAMGVRIDRPRNRLLVVISDLGVSERHSASGARSIAKLGEFDLATGALLRITDLAALRPPTEQHIANDVAVDTEGNAYVTDSLAPVIYKVDTHGSASVFVEDPRLLSGDGLNGNGITFHPDGYLLVAKKNEGALFKIPLPDRLIAPSLGRVQTDQAYVGADGLVLLDNSSLAIVTNVSGSVASERVYILKTKDDWLSSETVAVHPLSAGSYPTTGVLVDGRIYVANSGLNALLRNFERERSGGFSRRANLTPICLSHEPNR